MIGRLRTGTTTTPKCHCNLGAAAHRSTERSAARGSECCSARGGTPASPSPCTMRPRMAPWSAPASHALYACRAVGVGVGVGVGWVGGGQGPEFAPEQV